MERAGQSGGSSGAVVAGARRTGWRGDLAEGNIQPRQEAASGPRGLAGIVAPDTLDLPPSSRRLGRTAGHAAAQFGQLGAGGLSRLHSLLERIWSPRQGVVARVGMHPNIPIPMHVAFQLYQTIDATRLS